MFSVVTLVSRVARSRQKIFFEKGSAFLKTFINFKLDKNFL